MGEAPFKGAEQSKDDTLRKQEVIRFFNACAEQWNETSQCDDRIVQMILDNAKIKNKTYVLDVACGTGRLFPHYMTRDVPCVLGVDISPKMVEVAQMETLGDRRYSTMCADIEVVDLDKRFDCCMVYNAFPFFSDPDGIIRTLAEKLEEGGIISIAHGMSRARFNAYRNERLSRIASELIEEWELARLLSPYFKVTNVISNDDMYQVCGKKRHARRR